MTEKVYRIQNKKTGLFKYGGAGGGWGKKGKFWNGIGPLKLHLSMLREYDKIPKNSIPADWTILEYDLSISEPRVVKL